MRILKYVLNLFGEKLLYIQGKILGILIGKFLNFKKNRRVIFMFFTVDHIGELLPEISYFKNLINENYMTTRTNDVLYILKTKNFSNNFLKTVMEEIIYELKYARTMEIKEINIYKSSFQIGIKNGLNLVNEQATSNYYRVLPLKSQNNVIENRISNTILLETFNKSGLESSLKVLKLEFDFDINDKYIVILINSDLYKFANSKSGFFKYGDARSNYGSLRDLSVHELEDSINYLLQKKCKVVVLGRSKSGLISNNSNRNIIDLSSKLGEHISDCLDFYLIKFAVAALTTGTGADTILRLYEIPHLKINHYAYNFISNLNNNILLPTVYLNSDTGLPCAWSEIAKTQTKYGVQYNRNFWNNLGLSYRLPNSIEILEATKELVKIIELGLEIEGNKTNLLWYNNAMKYDKYWSRTLSIKKNNVIISENFLNKNESWLLS
jgi:putative glycosyltransferase (TIGR04372 family)